MGGSNTVFAGGEEKALSIFWREIYYLAKDRTLLSCNLSKYKDSLKTTELLVDGVLKILMIS